jgi:hypothetical protein
MAHKRSTGRVAACVLPSAIRRRPRSSAAPGSVQAMTQPSTTQTLTLRSPEDLLAAAPVVLGFVLSESVVMFTFDAASCFHARVDLPRERADVGECIDALLDPCLRHGVGRVLFVLYSGHPLPADRVARRLVRAFRGAGIEVVDVMRADGRRWFPLLRSRRSIPASGVPYDVSAHRFAAESVLSGRITHGSRADLETTVTADPAAVARVEAARDAVPPWSGWLPATVAGHIAAGTHPDDDEAARLLSGLGDVSARDAALGLLRRDNATAHVEFWADLVRRAPEALVAPAAALLGFAAWVSGNGALAWCAVDRCTAADPGYRLAHHLAHALTHAVPPSLWEEVTGMGDPA